MRQRRNSRQSVPKQKCKISNLINKNNVIDYDVKMSSYRNKDNLVKGFWVKRSITLKPLESVFILTDGRRV